MFPDLLHVGHVTVYTYGVLTVVAVLAAIICSVHLAKNEGISPAKMEGLALVIVLSAGVGSKLLTALDYPDFYSGNWQQVLGRGGVFYGGFLLAIAASALYCWRARLPGWQVADCVAPGLALAQGIGRIGCFLAGCCWGTPAHWPLAVTFTSQVAHDVTGVPLYLPLHPTQLYESALVLISISFLLWLRKHRLFPGEVMLVYAIYYAVIRFFLEFFRGDPRGYYFHGLLSTSQLIGLLIIPAAAFLWSRLQRRAVNSKRLEHPQMFVLKKARAKAV